VLRWAYEPPPSQSVRGRARRAGFFGLGEVLKRYEFADIGPNQVTQALTALDARLTPNQGLRRWSSGGLIAAPAPQIAGDQRTLLLVHGTFSQSDMWFEQLGATTAGRALLKQWEALPYGTRILAFDHPTLSVAPWLNALDLQALRGAGRADSTSSATAAAAWWPRGLLRLAPLPGTPGGLRRFAAGRHQPRFAPYRLRAALDMMANVANALSALVGCRPGEHRVPAGRGRRRSGQGAGQDAEPRCGIADRRRGGGAGARSDASQQPHGQQRRERAPVRRALAVAARSSFAVSADFEPDDRPAGLEVLDPLPQPRLAGAIDAGADLVFPGAERPRRRHRVDELCRC
jgi:hypothetical protein